MAATAKQSPWGQLVIAFVHKSLEGGIEFLDMKGHPLATELEVLEAFGRDRAFKRRAPNAARLLTSFPA